MAQGEHIELHRKRFGYRLDHHERQRKKEARSVKKRSTMAQKTLGLKGKMLAKRRHAEKATMKKTIAMHEEKNKKHKTNDADAGTAMPAYLLEREQVGMRCPRHALQQAPSLRACQRPAQAELTPDCGAHRRSSAPRC
jgi:ribosome biogenesis protein NSA2